MRSESVKKKCGIAAFVEIPEIPQSYPIPTLTLPLTPYEGHFMEGEGIFLNFFNGESNFFTSFTIEEYAICLTPPLSRGRRCEKTVPTCRGRAGVSERFYSGTSFRELLTMRNQIDVHDLRRFVTLAISNGRICKTLEISLPARLPGFIHSFGG
jgi:hypothetical protein